VAGIDCVSGCESGRVIHQPILHLRSSAAFPALGRIRRRAASNISSSMSMKY
jgi:hypothetical protein